MILPLVKYDSAHAILVLIFFFFNILQFGFQHCGSQVSSLDL